MPIGSYDPLSVRRFFMLHGSKVANYIAGPASNDFPDLGSIGAVS
ncbi:hypothetical protein GCM10023350_08000 [Nocardioides endophyticus]|uniref:Uncharacterized protein n=1 Tax=Nocardioides endophyticus TaxID=1353775 RepID=A0ABP8YFJ3_9ACTN